MDRPDKMQWCSKRASDANLSRHDASTAVDAEFSDVEI